MSVVDGCSSFIVFVHKAKQFTSQAAPECGLATGLYQRPTRSCRARLLTSLADDVAATKRAIVQQDGPVLLVGHSWGGMVISGAGNDPKVAGLVYVAAAAPNANQSLDELTKAALILGLQKIKADAGFLRLTPQGINEDFAQDLTPAERKVLVATQQPEAAKEATAR